jgi:hypothetical protein
MSKDAMYGIRWDIYTFRDADGEIAHASESGEDVCGLGPCVHDSIDGNLTLDEGLTLIADLIAGTGTGNPWDNAHAHIGVGDGVVPADAAQMGLMGANKLYKPMDATYPQRAGRVCTWRATFGPDDANFPWSECTIANGPDDTAVNLNRRVEQRGAKRPGDTVVFGVSVKFGAEMD